MKYNSRDRNYFLVRFMIWGSNSKLELNSLVYEVLRFVIKVKGFYDVIWRNTIKKSYKSCENKVYVIKIVVMILGNVKSMIPKWSRST